MTRMEARRGGSMRCQAGRRGEVRGLQFLIALHHIANENFRRKKKEPTAAAKARRMALKSADVKAAAEQKTKTKTHDLG